jgi:hypothetical protein
MLMSECFAPSPRLIFCFLVFLASDVEGTSADGFLVDEMS